MRFLWLVVLLVVQAGVATAGPILLVEQERSFTRSNSTNGDPPVVTVEQATDFSPFTTPGHDSTLSDNLLTGDLRAQGSASGPSPEIDTIRSANFRVEFDLLEPATIHLDGHVAFEDDFDFNLGQARVTFSSFDTNLGSFQPLFDLNATSVGYFNILDERFLNLPIGRYQFEASASGRGFWGSQGDVFGAGDVEFTFLATPQPSSGVLLGTALAVLAAARRHRSRAQKG